MDASSRKSDDQWKLSGYQYNKNRKLKGKNNLTRKKIIFRVVPKKIRFWESIIKSGYNRKFGIVKGYRQVDEVSKFIGTEDTLWSPDKSIEKIDANLTPTERVLQTLSTDPAFLPKISRDTKRFFK